MIIRYGGGNAGIREYLEEGRKMDRHFAREEMDRRIPIEGDLSVTQAIYESIEDNGQERYLHISLSFNEPDVTEESMVSVFNQYKAQLMNAYADDEFNIYAEIHWPKIKESFNHSKDEMESRYPHIHVVIPKRNLLSGRFLDPIGMHEANVKYLDAIQEKLNRDNGLSSPRDSPRVGTNHYESALSKYKEKEFKSKNGIVKQEIYRQVLDRDIRTESAFEELLREYGEVRIRNAGKSNQYCAVKIPGDEKFTNLKANIFNKAYIEDRALVLEPVSDAQVAQRIETWQQIQSREIKFISNASAKVKAHYKSLGLPERREYLTEREIQYGRRYRAHDANRSREAELPGLPEGNHKLSDIKFARGAPTEGASYLHELRARNVDHFRSAEHTADRLLLQSNEDNDLQHVPAYGSAGLRRDLYVGSSGRVTEPRLVDVKPDSSVLGALIEAEAAAMAHKRDLRKYAEIRKKLNPSHLLAYAQIKYGVNPEKHQISTAKDGSARIQVGKYNYNVSDFLTKHIGLEWKEAAEILDQLYEKQNEGIVNKPKSNVAHISDWRKFRDEVYTSNIKTFDQLRNEVKKTYSIGIKSINSEYFSRRRDITKDLTLTRSEKHYFRSVIMLEKLQKVEALKESINTQNRLNDRIKYPYSTLFYDFATKKEEFNVKILDNLKRKYQPTEEEQESPNVIGSGRPFTPENMPSGAEAAKRARLVAKLHEKEREIKELKLKMGDLRAQALPNGAVAFKHKDHGKQIFVNHPDRLELNRVTQPDEVAVGLVYAVERFGSPLEIKGTEDFQRQVIEVAAERDMDITFTDEKMNEALAAKRLELGLEPLPSNTIAVADLELDKSLPVDKAVDKALLESKVAELVEINRMPVSDSDAVTRRRLISDMDERHEELQSGFIDSKRVEEIAQEDAALLKHLEGAPEQQKVALRVHDAMESKDYGPAYRATVVENGPKELLLTIDASRVIASEAKQSAPQTQTTREIDSKEPVRSWDALSDSEKGSAAAIERNWSEVTDLEKNSLKPAIAREKVREDLEAIGNINNENERYFAAVSLGDMADTHDTYRKELEKQSPDVAREAASAFAENQQRIIDKENRKTAEYIAAKNDPDFVEVEKRLDAENRIEREQSRDANMQRIVAQSALIEMNLRHNQVKAGAFDRDQIVEVAKKDLEAIAVVKDEPEEKAIALGINAMMESSEDYRVYVAENAPEGLAATIGAAQAEPQQEVIAPQQHDNDIEM